MNVLEARRRLLGAGVYKKTVTGNPAIAQGSLARMYPGIEMQGHTEQNTVAGNQLFDKSTVVSNTYISDTNGLTLPDYAGERSASDYINVEGMSSVFATKMVGSGSWMAFYDNGKNFISSNEGIGYGVPITVPDNAIYARFTVRNEYIESFMVNEGSALLPYEPYTGGAPSPSPDYPQEIVNAGNYDETSGKYQYEVKLAGANLFNPNAEYVEGTYVGLPLNNKGKVSLILYEKNPDIDISAIFFGFTTNGYDASEGFNWAVENGEYSGGAIVNVVDDAYLSVYPKDKLDTVLEKYDVMVNYGTEPLPYQPYKEQTVTLTSDRPLTKWDKLTKKAGQWGWEYGSAEIVFDGSDDEKWIDYSSQNGFYIVISDMLTGNLIDGFCNSLIDYSISEYKYPSIRFGASNNVIYVTRVEDYASDVNAWKTWLQSNPITVLYQLAEPTFVPLSEAEQAQMNALHTNRPTTVLSNDADCEMTLTYKTKKSLEVTD